MTAESSISSSPFKTSSNLLICSTLLGYPSMMIKSFGELFIAEVIAPTTISSGTRFPFEIKLSILAPSSLPLATSARSKSPVE